MRVCLCLNRIHANTEGELVFLLVCFYLLNIQNKLLYFNTLQCYLDVRQTGVVLTCLHIAFKQWNKLSVAVVLSGKK